MSECEAEQLYRREAGSIYEPRKVYVARVEGHLQPVTLCAVRLVPESRHDLLDLLKSGRVMFLEILQSMGSPQIDAALRLSSGRARHRCCAEKQDEIGSEELHCGPLLLKHKSYRRGMRLTYTQ